MLPHRKNGDRINYTDTNIIIDIVGTSFCFRILYDYWLPFSPHYTHAVASELFCPWSRKIKKEIGQINFLSDDVFIVYGRQSTLGYVQLQWRGGHLRAVSFSHLHSSGYYIDPVRPKVRLVRRDPSSSPNGPIHGGFLSPRTSPLFFFLFILVYRKPTHFVIMIKATRYSNTLSIMMSSSFFIISRSFIPPSILQFLCPFSQ